MKVPLEPKKINAKFCLQPGHMSSARGARHRSWNGRSMESTSYTEEMRMRPIPRAPPVLRVLGDALRFYSVAFVSATKRFLTVPVPVCSLSLSLSHLVLCNLDSRAAGPIFH